MIELTILKVHHTGIAEARKLLPYIQECDVFGEENAGEAEEKAEFGEKQWERVLSYAKNLTAFRALQETAIYFDQDSGRKAYWQKVREYLFRNKVVIWHAERFSTEEARSLATRLESSNLLLGHALQDLKSGKVQDFLSQYWQYELDFNQLIDERDQHIGRQLSVAEERIRKRYAELKEKSCLRHAIEIGGNHSPENYCSLPCKVLDLRDQNTLLCRIIRGIRTGEYTDELKRNILAENAPHCFPQLASEKLRNLKLEEVIQEIKRVAH